ncbi:outer membrane protein [Helicobacter vulpis]|uniref:outer membrane protein n=1 Tax=Helicobacter vulpis TaxID=2316076 RepID=UPI000EABC5B5|nr:outer membrane protein [Helicobacter vulpis]
MKVSKRFSTLSLALSTCFGFTPLLDADDVTSISLVNSISGILGGNYSLSTRTGMFNGTADTAFGSATPTAISNPAGNAPLLGANNSYTNPYNVINPTTATPGVVSAPPTPTNNLYGLNSLLGGQSNIGLPNYIASANNVYNFSLLDSVIRQDMAAYSAYYNARTAFNGVAGADNILNPGQAVTGYYKISNQGNGNTASVTGALSASLVNAGSTSAADTALGTVYSNLMTLAGYLPGSATTPNYMTSLNSMVGTANAVGADFASALSASLNTSSAPAAGSLGSALSSLNSVLYSTPNATSNLITQTGGTYSVTANMLDGLQAMNTIDNLVGGMVSATTTGGSTTYALSSNYTNMLKALNTIQANLDTFANQVLNTPLASVLANTPNQYANTTATSNPSNNLTNVLNALASLPSGSINQSVVQSALNGLVNPNTTVTTVEGKTITNGYEATYYAYTALMQSDSLKTLQSALSVNGSTPTLTQTIEYALQLQNALNTANTAVAGNTTYSNVVFKLGANTSSLTSAQLATLYNAFNTTSSSAYNVFNTELSKLAGLVNTSSVNVSNTVSSNDSGGSPSANKVSAYPQAGVSGTSKYVTSWVSQSAANLKSYNSSYNSQLGKLLGAAMTYNGSVSSLEGLLNSSGKSALSNILTVGINNVAANALANGGVAEAASKADAINAQAQYINNMQAVFNSQNLLNTYVDTITRTYTTQADQINQASALTYLSGALNASAAQNGLIAQTKAAIVSALNSDYGTFLPSMASTLSASVVKVIQDLPTNTFSTSATPTQIADALGSFDTLTNMLTATKSTPSSAVAAATNATTLVDQNTDAIQIGKDVETVLTASVLPTGVTANNLDSLVTVLKTAIDGGSAIPNWAALDSTTKAALESLVGAASATGVPDDATGLLQKFSAALNQSAAPGTSGVAKTTATEANIKAAYTAAQTFSENYTNAFGVLSSALTSTPSSYSSAWLDLFKNTSTIADNLGYLSSSVAQAFENGTLTPQELSTQIQNIKTQIADYNSMGVTNTGTIALNAGLASSLGSGVNAAQNLGFANASVNTLATNLKGALPLLATNSGAPVSQTLLGNASAALGSLNSALDKLYNSSNNFFTLTNLNTTSGMNTSDPVSGVGNILGVGGIGGVPQNNLAILELSSLRNLNTVTSLVGNVIDPSTSAITTNYTAMAGLVGGASSAGSLQTNYTALVANAVNTNLPASTQLTSVVAALMPIQQALVAGQITQSQADTQAASALSGIVTTGNASSVWQAYEKAMGFGTISGTPNTVNQVKNLNALLTSSQNLSTVSGVVQVLTDANTLYNANKGLTGGAINGVTNTNTLSVSTTSGASNTPSALLNAQSAASALSALLGYFKSANLSTQANGDLTTEAMQNIATVINALNSYNHNVALLNSLTDNKGSAIAGEVLGYLQGNSSYQNLTTKSASASAINTLQNLLNRLSYLEGLQTQVQDAINNNPYAMIMQANTLVSSNSYQNAAKALITTSTNNGLFNTATSTLYNPGDPTTIKLSSTFGNLNTQVSADLSNASTWNALINNIGTSNSILANPTGITTSSQPALNLGKVANSIYNLVDLLSPASVNTSTNTINTSTNQTSVSDMLNNYAGVNTQQSNLKGVTLIVNASSGSALGAALTNSQLVGTAKTGSNTTVLEGFKGIVDLGSMLGTNAGNLNTTNYTNAVTAGGLSNLGTQVAAITKWFSTNLTSNANGVASGSAPSGVSDVSSTGDVTFLNTLISTLENNSATIGSSGKTLSYYIANSAQIGVGSNATAAEVVAAVKPLLEKVMGSTAAATTNADTIVATGGNGTTTVDVNTWLASINTLINTSGALQTINKNLANPVALQSNFTTNLQDLLTNALNLYNANKTATAVMANTQLNGTTNAITAASYGAISQLVDNADAIFSVKSFNGTTAGSGQGIVNPQEAVLNYIDNITSVSDYNAATAPTSPTNLQGLVAQELKNAGATGSTLGALLSSATAAQKSAAASAIVQNGAFQTNGLAGGSSASQMQQQVVNQTIASVLKDASTYTTASDALKPLLNSSTSVADILKAAVNNATSVKNFNSLLNPSNAQGISISKGTLSNANIATIQSLLKSMGVLQTSLNGLNQAIDKNQDAAMINNLSTASSVASATLRTLQGINGPISNTTASTYVTNSRNAIAAEVFLLINQANSPNVGQLLNALKTLATSNNLSTSGNAQLVATNNTINSVFTQIIGSGTINPNAALNNLDTLISDLQNLQVSLVNQLASSAGYQGVSSQAQGTSITPPAPTGTVMAILLPGNGKMGSVLDQQLTPTQIAALLPQIQKALVYAQAAKMKFENWMQTQGYTASAARPMQTMNSNGNMYGIDVQFGYKQFFGKKKRWGLRYYASFSYQHGTFMDGDTSELDNFVYGAGVDALYNFYESKDAKYTSGLFAGLMLAGSTWNVKGASAWISRMNAIKAAGGSAQMNTSYFQIPLNIGFRTNVNKHNGFEIGLRIPLAVNYYFKGSLDGMEQTVAYKRNVSVFFNYVYNF